MGIDVHAVRNGMTARYRNSDGTFVGTGRIVAATESTVRLRIVLAGHVTIINVPAERVLETWWQS